jgi:hypothetical protein
MGNILTTLPKPRLQIHLFEKIRDLQITKNTPVILFHDTDNPLRHFIKPPHISTITIKQQVGIPNFMNLHSLRACRKPKHALRNEGKVRSKGKALL